MEKVFKVIIIIIVSLIVGTTTITYLSPQSYEEQNLIYRIEGGQGGSGSHSKTDLFFIRTSTEDNSDISQYDLTKNYHYSDITQFIDWKIYNHENHVIVTWNTIGQDWSDIFLATSDDYGETFQINNISQTRQYIDNFEIRVVDSQVYIVWKENLNTVKGSINHLYFTKSDNYGKNFNEPMLLNTPGISAYEFDMEANDEIVFVAYREDTVPEGKSNNYKNIIFANIWDDGTHFSIFSGTWGANADFVIKDKILYGTWVGYQHDTQVFYGVSNDYGETFENIEIIFDPQWEISPYADTPRPQISFDDELAIVWSMYNAHGENEPYRYTPFVDDDNL